MKHDSQESMADVDIRPRRIGRVGIIGAGHVSRGLAMALVDANIPVTILDADRDALDRTTASMRSSYRKSATDGEISSQLRDWRIGLFSGTRDLHHLKDCDLIIETTPAQRVARQALFRELDQMAKPGAILATNAADADISEIGRATKRPGDVLGLRFLGREDAGKLFEVVLGKETSPAVVATAITLAYETRSVTTISGQHACSPLNRISRVRDAGTPA